jgi:hypothetical protein
MEMACHCRLWSLPGNAATRQTSALSLTPFPCLDQGEDVRANAQRLCVSIVLMVRVIIDDRSSSGVSVASVLNDSTHRIAACAKAAAVVRLRDSTPKRTKAAMSLSARSTD